MGSKPRNKARRGYDPKYIAHNGRGFVYFVIQKVACSSVKTALLPLFDVDDSPYWDTTPVGHRRLRVHKLFDKSPYQIGKEQLLGGLDEEYRDHFKFAFVRNPWDRLVSCHFEKFTCKNAPGLKTPGGVELYAGMPFAEFVEAVHAIPDEDANPHFRSQHMTVCCPGGRVMADFVGRFENLREDFAVVAEKIGAPELELPHQLKSPNRKSRPYTDFYNERLKKLVHERYEKDVETFGYSF
jgi:chondroitin 4-sulfotransferase 11